MHRMLSRLTSLLVVAASLFGSGCADPCGVASVSERLRLSAPGDTISIEGCTVVGDLLVPTGRTLAGPATVIGSVTVETSSGSTTTLEDIDVTSERVAIRTEGAGTAVLDSGIVRVETGIGLSLAALETEVRDMTISGNVTEANRDESRWLSVTSSTEATHGVVIGAGRIQIEGSTIVGFAWAAISAGAGLVEGGEAPIGLNIATSTVGRGLGVGIVSSAAATSLDHVEIVDVWTGVRGWPSYGVLVLEGDLSSGSSSITSADGFGLVQIGGGESDHGDLVIEHTGDVGAWFGTGVAAGFLGAGTRIADTGFAGIVAVDAMGLAMLGGTIEGVRAERRTVGPSGAIEVGDGIDAVGTRVILRDLTIGGCARAGLLVDEATAPSFVNVRISSEGAGLGAVLGSIDRSAEDFSAVVRVGWDTGIVRTGAALTNDAAFAGNLPVVVAGAPPSTTDALGVIAPMY